MPIDAQSELRPVVVVVDANLSVQRNVAELLRPLPARVVGFSTAAEFLRTLDAGLAFSCLIADLSLPDQSAVTLLDALKARGITAPTILLSGDSEVHTAVDGMRAGAINCIEKPYLARFLLEQVAPLIDGARPQPYHASK
jgi:FixJ family two-component response regulator